MKLVSIYESVEYESRGTLRRARKQLKKVNKLTEHYRNKTDEQIKDEIERLRPHFNIKNKEHIVRLYAMAREVTFRLLGKFQYDVQVLGGLAALERKMIQMSTGSGKTITLILPVVAYGMTGKGCNVLTVNEYLSERDWKETKPVYDFFGITNAYTNTDASPREQQRAFACDITYSTNSTLGFAYLNSNLATGIGEDVKIIERPLHSAIIDEVDEILMDDARNPLIIASSVDTTDELMFVEHKGRRFETKDIVEKLKTLRYMERDEEDPRGGLIIGEKAWDEIQELFGVDDSLFANEKFIHIIQGACDAIYKHKAFEDYVVMPEPDPDSGSRVVLIDKATGRLSHGRTLSDNMHAFVEIKEGVFTGSGNESSIQITYQILFGLFENIAGVTGTLGASYKEFYDIYETGVVVIPDRFPNQLKQYTNLYATHHHLMADVVRKVGYYQACKNPVLIGCPSDNVARMVSDILKSHTVKHHLLVSTDKNEEVIVERAGRPKSVVVTTDIMGRGTDIKVEDTQLQRGLVVLQVGARPNSRVERQFAGRAARQGEPGKYHRMLCVPELEDMGLFESQLKKIRDYEREHRQYIANVYNGDILMDAQASYYDEVVGEIDEALKWSESSHSSQRVQEYKMSSITDLIQVATVAKLDEYRQVLKDSIETQSEVEIRELVAKLTLPEKERTKYRVRSRIGEIQHIPFADLQQILYSHIQHLTNEVIQMIREYSEGAMRTARMTGISKMEVKPEDYMSRLMLDFMREIEDEFVIHIDGIN